MKFTGDSFILTITDTLCIKIYSNDDTGDCFAVGFGQFFGKDWIHVQSGTWDFLSEESARYEYNNMLARAPEHVHSMDKARSGALVCTMQSRLGQLTLRTGVVWKSSRENGVKLEVFRDPSFDCVSGEWTCFRSFDVSVCTLLPYQHCHFCS